jgi:hypothetical protein
MKGLRYKKVISLEKQEGVKGEINKWANKDPKTCWRWDQVPGRSMHPLLTGCTSCEPISNAKNLKIKSVSLDSVNRTIFFQNFVLINHTHPLNAYRFGGIMTYCFHGNHLHWYLELNLIHFVVDLAF